MNPASGRGRGRKWATVAAVSLLAVYALLRWFEYESVYHPDKYIGNVWVQPGHDVQEVWFTAKDGPKLNGWFYPAATNSPRSGLAFLVCHGNGGNISCLERLGERLLNTGANVLLFDYRGYGRSEGRPSEEGTYEDAQAAYQWLRRAGFAATNIIVYGESLGGGPATELAVRETLGGLVLESTFSSIPDIGAELYPWLPVRTVSTIKYDTRSKLQRLKLPVLVMHSRGDGLIPFEQARRNFEAANEPKLFWELYGGHAAADEQCQVGAEKFIAALEMARARGGGVKF
jgi:fermentation-respiration switch protein FrsA (DUF1100 family)